MNVESGSDWILKNIVNHCLYQGGENSRRITTREIKTYDEVFTGQMPVRAQY